MKMAIFSKGNDPIGDTSIFHQKPMIMGGFGYPPGKFIHIPSGGKFGSRDGL